MFYFLHRAVIALVWLFWAAIGLYLYQQRAMFEPAFFYLASRWNDNLQAPKERAEMSGRITAVFSGASLQLRNPEGVLYNFGLAGDIAPKQKPNASPKERRAFGESKTNLMRLVLNQEARITITLSNPATRTGLGVVHIGATNVNLEMIAQGQAALKPEQIRTLPIKDQYAFILAEKQARQRGLGIWKDSPQEPTR